MKPTAAVDLRIPYFVPKEELPAELPSEDAIEQATDILSDTTGVKVVGLGPHFVVKFGPQVSVEEGRVMIFLQQTTSIRVPKVYALDVKDHKAFIIMERIDGNNLEEVWADLSNTEKKAVAQELKSIFTELRSLPSSNYCSLGGRPLQDRIFWTGIVGQDLGGPFETETQLNDALIQKYCLSGYLPQEKANFYANSFPSVFTGHRATFTHGDFQRKNVIWDRARSSVVILDWEFAGWYPSYWEYARALYGCVRWNDDWNEWIDLILDPYLNEWAWMQMLIPELFS